MDIKVNDAEWKALGSTEQQQIEKIISGCFKGDRVVADAAGVKAPTTRQTATADGICETACNIAEQLALAACDSISNPIAKEVCKVVAREAGKECRKKC